MIRVWASAFSAILMIAATGCAVAPGVGLGLESRTATPAAGEPPATEELASAAAPASQGELRLQEALRIAMDSNPTFAEFAANRAAAQALVVQSLLRPNPELEASTGVAHSRGETAGEIAPELSVGVIQPIELRAKRAARTAAAEAGLKVVEREEEGFRLALRKEVAHAYWTLAFRQQERTLAEEASRLAAEVEGIVQQRVSGGESAKVDRIKASLETLRAKRGIRRADRGLLVARGVLNSLCGGKLGDAVVASDPLSAEPHPADLGGWITGSAGHPSLMRIDASIEMQHRIIQREKTAWYPDLRPGITAGHESDKDAVALSLGIELPIFNRNQGGIAGAKAELARLEAERARTTLEIRRDVEQAWHAVESAREQADALDAEMRQGAAEALNAAKLLYEHGETDLLPVIEAQRTAREVETEYLRALYDGALARAELERAAGKPQ